MERAREREGGMEGTQAKFMHEKWPDLISLKIYTPTNLPPLLVVQYNTTHNYTTHTCKPVRNLKNP